MPIALIRVTDAHHATGTNAFVDFPTPVPPGRLLLMYAFRQDATTDTSLPTGPAQFERTFTHLPYEFDKDGGALFAGISDGSQEMGGVDGVVGPFGPSLRLLGAEFSGSNDPVAADTDLGIAEVLTTDETISRTVTTPAGGLAVMVMQTRNFSGEDLSAAGSSTELVENPPGGSVSEIEVLLVYRLGSGSLQNDIFSDGADPRWNQASAASFGPGTVVSEPRVWGYILD